MPAEKKKPVLRAAPSGWALVRAKILEAEQRAKGSDAKVLGSIEGEGHDPELVKRARAIADKLKGKQGARAKAVATALRDAAKAALRELKKKEVSGDDDDDEKEESSWWNILKVAEKTLSFGAAIFFAWILYKLMK